MTRILRQIGALRITTVVLLVSQILFAGSASAACYCACMDGKNQPICDAISDDPPVCLEKICPVETPKIALAKSKASASSDGSECAEEQVWDPDSERYVLQTICW